MNFIRAFLPFLLMAMAIVLIVKAVNEKKEKTRTSTIITYLKEWL